MAGFIPNEGEALIANLVFKNADVDRGTDLQLGLFTNASVGETTALSGITEPTGGSYARKTLADANWTGSGDTRSYALQTFSPVTTGYTGAIYGYFLATTGTTPRLLAIEVDLTGPYTLNADDTYDITPVLTVA